MMFPKSDCIFVFAGRESRKFYGLDLFREGISDILMLSVGRYEWRRFLKMQIIDEKKFKEMVQSTPPPKRHFFVKVQKDIATSYPIVKGKFGTLSEARALSQIIIEQEIKKIVVVSSEYHLKRAVESIRKFCSHQDLKLYPAAVPHQEYDFSKKTAISLIRRSRILFIEVVKYYFYKWILFPFCKPVKT